MRREPAECRSWKKVWILAALALLAAALPAQARLYFTGSNPITTIIAYPQDLAHPFYNRELFSYSLTYALLPWWGNMDIPTAKPNDSYTATEQDVIFDANAWFGQSSSRQLVDNKLEYLKSWSRDFRTQFTLHFATQDMLSTASGNLEYEDPTTGYIPFTYMSNRDLYTLGLQAIAAFKFLDMPAGVKLAIDDENTGSLASHLAATVNSENISSDRILWGWATTPCSHIFTKHEIDGDAWLLDSYTVGSKLKLDAQVGLTLPGVKLGNHFRYTGGVMDQYGWSSSAPAGDTLHANFDGHYALDPWAVSNSLLTERIYANVNWRRTPAYAMNTYFFLGVDAFNSKEILRSDHSVESDWQTNNLSLAVEANPNINFYLNKDVTIDAALLLEFCYTRYENTYNRWNGALGGEQKRFQGHSVDVGLEYPGEQFSYADEPFLDIGFETEMILTIFKNEQSELKIFPDLMFNSKLTYTTKYYGNNSDAGFTVNNLRSNFKREAWFNAFLSAYYRYQRLNFRLDIVEPLIYALLSETSVLDSSRNVLYSSRKVNPWAIQDGVQITLWVGYEF